MTSPAPKPHYVLTKPAKRGVLLKRLLPSGLFYKILGKLAATYQKKEAWDKVAATCAKAEKIAPKFANYYFLHGHALMEQAVKGPTGWADARALHAVRGSLENARDPDVTSGPRVGA